MILVLVENLLYVWFVVGLKKEGTSAASRDRYRSNGSLEQLYCKGLYETALKVIFVTLRWCCIASMWKLSNFEAIFVLDFVRMNHLNVDKGFCAGGVDGFCEKSG